MARKYRIPPNVIAAREARIKGEDPVAAEREALRIMKEEAEQELAETTLESFWQAPDTLNDPPPLQGADTDEAAQERLGVWPPSRREKMTRELIAPRRQSRVFRATVAKEICRLIAQGQVLQQICGQNGIPSIEIVNGWLQDNARFQRMYARARHNQGDYLADEMLILASLVRQNPREAGAYKVAAEILKWQASVRNSKYNPATKVEVTEVQKTTEQIQKEIAALAAEFNVPLADLPANVTPIRKRTGTGE
jgi:hypothetical protein